MGKSPDPPPARNTCCMKIPGSIFLPDECSRESPIQEMGLWLTLGPNGIKGPSNVTHILPSCRAHCASGNNIPSHDPTIGRVSLFETSLSLFLLSRVKQLVPQSRCFLSGEEYSCRASVSDLDTLMNSIQLFMNILPGIWNGGRNLLKQDVVYCASLLVEGKRCYLYECTSCRAFRCVS